MKLQLREIRQLIRRTIKESSGLSKGDPENNPPPYLLRPGSVLHTLDMVRIVPLDPVKQEILSVDYDEPTSLQWIDEETPILWGADDRADYRSAADRKNRIGLGKSPRHQGHSVSNVSVGTPAIFVGWGWGVKGLASGPHPQKYGDKFNKPNNSTIMRVKFDLSESDYLKMATDDEITRGLPGIYRKSSDPENPNRMYDKLKKITGGTEYVVALGYNKFYHTPQGDERRAKFSDRGVSKASKASKASKVFKGKGHEDLSKENIEKELMPLKKYLARLNEYEKSPDISFKDKLELMAKKSEVEAKMEQLIQRLADLHFEEEDPFPSGTVTKDEDEDYLSNLSLPDVDEMPTPEDENIDDTDFIPFDEKLTNPDEDLSGADFIPFDEDFADPDDDEDPFK